MAMQPWLNIEKKRVARKKEATFGLDGKVMRMADIGI